MDNLVELFLDAGNITIYSYQKHLLLSCIVCSRYHVSMCFVRRGRIKIYTRSKRELGVTQNEMEESVFYVAEHEYGPKFLAAFESLGSSFTGQMYHKRLFGTQHIVLLHQKKLRCAT